MVQGMIMMIVDWLKKLIDDVVKWLLGLLKKGDRSKSPPIDETEV